MEPSSFQINLRLSNYNYYFEEQISRADIVDTFSGVRPLIKSHADPRCATRDYAIEKQGNLITVFGGKWTTSRALAEKLVKEI